MSGYYLLRFKKLNWLLAGICISILLNSACFASENSDLNKGKTTMKIRFVFDDRTVTATLSDNASSRDFITKLPLTYELEDYAGNEKIAYIPGKLSTEGSPKGVTSKAGDIAYYAPWGNIVIFYKDFGYASGLITLGKIDTGLDRFKGKQSMKVTIELAD